MGLPRRNLFKAALGALAAPFVAKAGAGGGTHFAPHTWEIGQVKATSPIIPGLNLWKDGSPVNWDDVLPGVAEHVIKSRDPLPLGQLYGTQELIDDDMGWYKTHIDVWSARSIHPLLQVADPATNYVVTTSEV